MRVELLSGSYTSRSVIANAQRCVNLYPETNEASDQPEARVTHYPTPGLTLNMTLPTYPIRALYRCSNTAAYAVAGQFVYAIDPVAKTFSVLGTIADGTTPVSMTDNGIFILLVDGTGSGYSIQLVTNVFAKIADPNFRGGNRVDFLDTFFINNVTGTPQFQVSGSLALTWDPLYFANKQAHADNLVVAVVAKREIWLLGDQTTEIFYNAGAPDFPFQVQPGVFIDHGCVARYSVAQADNSVLWLSRDRQGQGIVLQGSGYAAKRISTFAIEEKFATYIMQNAVGFCYQQEGHTFYVLSFPESDATWVYDLSTSMWHERVTLDSNGGEHRWAVGCCTAYGALVLGGDYASSNIYTIDVNSYTDNGQPIKRIRSFPHIVADGYRRTYKEFTADMSVAATSPNIQSLIPGGPLLRQDGSNLLRENGTPYQRENVLGAAQAPPLPQVALECSDDRGVSFGDPVLRPMGGPGQYLTSIQWRRLGMARDRVFRLSWSEPIEVALQGAWVDSQTSRS